MTLANESPRVLTFLIITVFREPNPGPDEGARLGWRRGCEQTAMDVRRIPVLFDNRHHDHW